MVAALWVWQGGPAEIPAGGEVLAVLPFFFNWHSDARYLYFAPLLIFGAVAMESAEGLKTNQKAPESIPIHRNEGVTDDSR